MPKFSYRITFTRKNDLWNWYDASLGGAYGLNWRDRLHEPEDLALFDRLTGLTRRQAEVVLAKALAQRQQQQRGQIRQYRRFIKAEYAAKFLPACKALEKITGRALFFSHYLIKLTTFPRCPYDPNHGSLFTVIGDQEPIGTFLHEVLHFQVHQFWEKDLRSGEAALTHDEFHELKEALTVVLDKQLKPLLKTPDTGYLAHRALRQKLHRVWGATHDLQQVILAGVPLVKSQ